MSLWYVITFANMLQFLPNGRWFTPQDPFPDPGPDSEEPGGFPLLPEAEDAGPEDDDEFPATVVQVVTGADGSGRSARTGLPVAHLGRTITSEDLRRLEDDDQ